MKLTTERLILRAPTNKDIGDLIEGLNNLEVSGNLESLPYPYTKKEATEWVERVKKMFRKKESESISFNIELKSERKIIGGIDFHKINYFKKTADIAYWLNKDYWRQGIISEAVKEILSFGFGKLGLRRVNLHAYTSNEASNAVAKKFGFVFEGTLRKEGRPKSTGKIHDINAYGLLGSEYK